MGPALAAHCRSPGLPERSWQQGLSSPGGFSHTDDRKQVGSPGRHRGVPHAPWPGRPPQFAGLPAGTRPCQRMPRTSWLPPLEEPTAFCDPTGSPPSHGHGHVGDAVPLRVNFSFCFLSAYTSYRPLGPAPPSPTLPSAQPRGGRPPSAAGSPGSARFPCCCRGAASTAGVPLLLRDC